MGSERVGRAGEIWRGVAASAAALVIAFLLVALILRVSSASAERDQAETAERHSYDVMLLVRGVDGAMARSEAALSRFIMNGDRSVGTIYYNEWLSAGQQLAQLRGMVRDDPDQAELVAGLTLLYNARGDELAQVAEQAAYRRGWSALKLFNQAGNSRTVPSIARSLQAIADHERATLGSRAERSTILTSEANSVAWSLSLAGLLLIVTEIGLGVTAMRALGERARADEQTDAMSDRAAQLEAAVAERTRELSDANARLQAEMAERATAEEQLRQAQKMEAVGQLTGGIAHDFNNMLAVVVGGIELARRRIGALGREASTADIARQLDSAMEGAERAAGLTRRLLGFARAEPLLPEGVNPAELIAGMADLLDRTLGERIAIQTELDQDAGLIWVDPHQLENAILNLAVNARDAMDGHGRLTISVRGHTLGDGEIGAAPAGDYVRIAVTDDGAGIAPPVLKRVFEPFFTTKPAGKGTGLGLSQVFGFVRQSEGEVAIASSVGEGTEVALYLPRHVGAVAEVVAPANEDGARHGGDEPVLLVEDDPRVRAATAAALEELGYRPIVCEGGDAALAVLEERHDVRIVVTDVVMPGMTGPELAAAIRVLWPEIAILFVSGFVGEAGDAERFAGDELLRKPFTIAQLGRAVAAALARAGEAADAPPLSAPSPAPRVAAAG